MGRSSATDASRIVQDWAEWAAAEVDAGRLDHLAEVADAYQALVGQFSDELSRRTDPAEIRRHAAGMQGVAAEAGYWLSRSGQPAEAVQVVEAARAVLLTARVQRLPGELGRRLAAAGRSDLFEAYRQAESELDERERHRYDPSNSGDGPTEPAPNSVLTPERQAWSRFHMLRQEITRTLGATDVTSGYPPEQVRWGAADGRLTYLAAAHREGYALVVDRAEEPRHLSLPGLTAEAVAKAVTRFRQLTEQSSQDVEAWDTLLRWLGTAAMGRLLDGLPSGVDLVLVPLGGLGLLPLHAAVLPAEPIGTGTWTSPRYALERADIRYAPNARLAIEARRNARPGPPGVVMVAGVNEPPLIDKSAVLKHAEREADLVCATIGERCRPVQPATLSAVRAELDGADVWHFACHGVADAADPLDSAILLADEPLRLRHLLGRPAGRHRLAVLSACQTNVPDAVRMDEVVGFPGALMRAGVSGVIATQWSIGDAPAILLMQRFYELWLAGSNPAAALCAAQRWLRNATMAEIGPLLSRHRRGRPVTVEPASPAPSGPGAKQPFLAQPWAWAAFTYTGV